MKWLALLHTCVHALMFMWRLCYITSSAVSNRTVNYMPFFNTAGAQAGRQASCFWVEQEDGAFQETNVCYLQNAYRWASVKSPADTSKVQSPLLLQRKCCLLADSLNMVSWGFYLYELNGTALVFEHFWKMSALNQVDVQKSSTGFEIGSCM